MTKREYIKRMKAHQGIFDTLWEHIVADTNEFILINATVNEVPQKIESFIDQLCLSGAWIDDRLKGYTSIANRKNPKYNKSLTRQIRKALGYNV